MSEKIVYLIPKEHFEVGGFKAKVETIFEKLKLIDRYYDEQYNWFAAGDNAHLLFSDNELDTDARFEYVEIHDTGNSRLLPEGLQAPVACKICNADVSDDVNDFLFSISEKEYDEKRETNMLALEFLCPNCGIKSRLSALAYNEPIALTDQYICFVGIPGEINRGKFVEIEGYIGTTFELIYNSI